MTNAHGHVPAFQVKQKINMMVNRYEINAVDPSGAPTGLLAFAEQKRMAMKEQVTFFTDAGRTTPLFGFKARKVMDLGSGYDITDASGTPIGYFKKDFGASLMRSTFHLESAGVQATGQERNQLVAVLRRFTDLSFLPVHFDFVDSAGATVLAVQREFSVGDKYQVNVPNPHLDFRVAAAMAVALDALMAR
ncbi:hypothetical protein [Pseudactinotalea terrae]|uniref:hypothetical protein n=1 Tax=Pseudactinotalea terrae TaxID=1743262 RepID=UPI0012E2E51A|nr:hypothetical protein [Pseudactinotalea terrae]